MNFDVNRIGLLLEMNEKLPPSKSQELERPAGMLKINPFVPMHTFSTPENMFPGGRERVHWERIG